MSVVNALYLVLLAAVAGYVLIARVPSLLHTPMLSGSNFIHGIVLAGAMLALSSSTGVFETTIGFVAVMAASANVVGGFVVTDRMLNLFNKKGEATSLTADAGETGAGGTVDKPGDTAQQISADTSQSSSSTGKGGS